MTDLLIVVRHRKEKERSMDVFIDNNLKLLKPNKVIYIAEEPFSNTWRECIRRCKEIDFKHCLMMDADTYIIEREYVLDNLNTDFYSEFCFYDKFRGKHIGGLHYYNKETMDGLYEYFKQDELFKTDLWFLDSEWATIRQFCIDNGYGKKEKKGGFNRKEKIILFHDYCQYRKDIVYKYVYRGWRDNRKQSLGYINEWSRHEDEDFIMAAKGLEWALNTDTKNFKSNDGIMKKDIKVLLESIKEKNKEVTPEEINKMLADKGKFK